METLWQDIRYGARMLLKNRGVTLIAVLTLALGIGANTTIFAWFNTMLIDVMPGVERVGDIVLLTLSTSSTSITSVSYPTYKDLRDKNDVLAGLIVMDVRPVSLDTGDSPERAWSQLVSGNFFDVLGVKMARGRGFLPEEDRVPGRDAVAVISHALWERRFGADPAIIGRKVNINNRPFTIVGVTNPDFKGAFVGLAFDLYLPVMMQETVLPGGSRLDSRGSSWMDSMARLKPGVTRAQAEASLNVLMQNLAKEYPDELRDTKVRLHPLWNSPVGATHVMLPVLSLLLAVAGVVLLIACANVANLLLTRAAARRKEVAMRLALGASRGRLVRQMLTEHLLLAAAGGVLGTLVSMWTAGLLDRLVPPMNFPISVNPQLEWPVLGFAFGVTLLTSVFFGLMPALQASRSNVASVLKDEAGSVSAAGSKARLRQGLVVVQVSLSLMLLIVAGLFLRSIERAQSFRPGFEPRGVLLASLDLFSSGYDRARGLQFQQQLLERLRQAPGVESAALARRAPLGMGGSSSSTITVDGYTAPEDRPAWGYISWVSTDYWKTMQIPMARGRVFGTQDADGAPLVAVINETMAQRYWGERDPIGSWLQFGNDRITVVGIAKNSKLRSLTEPPVPLFYLCMQQFYRTDVMVHVRATRDAAQLGGAIREAVASLDATLPVFHVVTLEEHIRAASVQQRMSGTLLAVFGAIALTLAAIGIYGVISFSVTQRTREIGIRVALGAQKRDVLRLILRHGMGLLGIGGAIGVLGAVAAGIGLRKLLFGVSALDPVAFAGVALLLGTVALVACWIPARRATKVDPMVALRYE